MSAEKPPLTPPTRFHDESWERPVRSRYVDPTEVIWLATATRLGLTIRRDPAVYSMTDGAGSLWFSTRDHLDEDDNLGQMLFHEICHWVTNGIDSFDQRDWGFPLYDGTCPKEHAALRLQAWWSGRHGLRAWMSPTGAYRQYTDQLPPDPLAPLDDSPWEQAVVELALQAVETARHPRVWGPVEAALGATAGLRLALEPFVDDYRTEHADDSLPLLWRQRHDTDR